MAHKLWANLHLKWMYCRSLLFKTHVTNVLKLQLSSFPASQWLDLVDFFHHLTDSGRNFSKHRFRHHPIDFRSVELFLEYRILRAVSDHQLNLDYLKLLRSLLDIHGRMNQFLLFNVKNKGDAEYHMLHRQKSPYNLYHMHITI